MPANLNAQSRYRIIDRCLGDRFKRYWSYPEINVKLEEHDIQVCKRTFEKDLETLRHDTRLAFYAPIVYCKINHAYYYDQKNYSLITPRLSDEESDALRSGLAFVKAHKEVGEVQQLYARLEKTILRLTNPI